MEKLTTLESVYLLRQGLDVRPLAAERPPRKRGKDGQVATVDTDADGPEPDHGAEPTDAEEAEPAGSAEPTVPPAVDAG